MTRPTASTPRTRRMRAGLLAAALVTLAACGMEEDGGSTSDDAAASSAAPSPSSSAAETSAPAGTAAQTQAGGTIEVTSEDFSFAVPSEELAAGEYTIELTNGGSASHDLVVERDGEDVAATQVIGPDDSSSVTVQLEPGEYVFYCSVGNHRSMGMEVTVTVT